MKLPVAFFFIIFLFLNPSQAQLPDSCKLQIGTNLAGPVDWGAEWPFVDVMKYSRRWITHNNEWVSGGTNAWDTDVLNQIPLDENGYPLELPVDIPDMEAPQIVRTVWANTESMKEGVYVVLYDGEGVIDLWGDATILDQQQGRIEFELAFQDDLFALELMESSFGNHLRNIRVLMPGTETSYQDNPWSEEWLEKLEPFQTLRFMDWGHTNSSPLTNWDERPKVDDYTYTLNGMPYEWMIEISNLRQSDAWVCIPHAADEEFIRNLAKLFRDNLDPNLKCYVEYSNEIWNWIFEQTHYCFDNGDQNIDWPERIVPFVQNALDIWTEEWAGDLERLVRVVGVQHAWQDVSNRIVFNMEPGSFDAFSPAAYFGFTEEGYEIMETLGANATAEDVIFWARQGMLDQAYEWTKSQNESISETLGIPMIYYEGGQHLTPQPFGSEQPYNDALVAAQFHPEMYNLYNEWYDSLRVFVKNDEPTVLMNFSFIGPTSGRYGSWGLLQNQFTQNAPYDDSPKYRAVTENVFDCAPKTNTEAPFFENEKVKIGPNPTAGEVTIEINNDKPYEVIVFTEDGVVVERNQFQGFQKIILPDNNGIYFFRISDIKSNQVTYRKVILQK